MLSCRHLLPFTRAGHHRIVDKLIFHSKVCVSKHLRTGGRWNSDDDRPGNLSESEQWLRAASDTESRYGGNVSAFEDEEGNPLRPTGQLTNAIPLRSLKQRSAVDQTSQFIDWRRVKFKAGNGGNGMISFLQLFANENAGPDGGDGGNGGHIVLRADSQVKSLANVKSLYFGEHGENGMSRDMTGYSGKHMFISVPVGTLIKQELSLGERMLINKQKMTLNNVEQPFYKIVADLSDPGSMFFAAKGGAGGKGNHFFLSNDNRKPKVAERGGAGEEHVYILEMKTIAHVGLVGFPNAGKSTLLRSISRAKPKVASYPFTTLKPELGIVQFNDLTQLVVADLPGLIEGAHKNRGLGHNFLKHLERCVCLIYVLDLSQTDAVGQFEILKQELELYRPGLSRRPHAVVGNKIDLPGAREQLELLREHIRQHTPETEVPLPVIPMSAKYGTNLVEYLKHIRGLYDLYNKPEVDEPGFEW